MTNLKDLITLTITLALVAWAVMLAGQYWGWNESTMNVWALAGVFGLFVTSRYYAWWRH